MYSYSKLFFIVLIIGLSYVSCNKNKGGSKDIVSIPAYTLKESGKDSLMFAENINGRSEIFAYEAYLYENTTLSEIHNNWQPQINKDNFENRGWARDGSLQDIMFWMAEEAFTKTFVVQTGDKLCVFIFDALYGKRGENFAIYIIEKTDGGWSGFVFR
jgi:hypothetical protein